MREVHRRVLLALCAGMLAVAGLLAVAAGPVAASGEHGGQPALSREDARRAASALDQPRAKAFRQTVSAVVNNDGSLAAAQSFGAVSATRLGTGTYQVLFNQNITRGTYTASIGLAGNVGASAPGEITVVGRVGTANGLFIQTHDSAGALTDRGFHVVAMF